MQRQNLLFPRSISLRFGDYSLRAKLFVTIGFYVLLMMILGAIGFGYITRLASQFNDLYENNLKAAVQLANAESALWQLRYGFPQFIALDDEAARAQIIADEPKWYGIINENMDAYAAGSRTPEELEALQKWNDVFPKYVEARPRWFELYAAGKIEEAAEWRAQTTTPFGRDSVATLGQLIELQRTIADQKQSEVSASAAVSIIILLSVAGLALIIGLGVGLFVARSLYGPINRLTEVSQQIAGGNLEARAIVESRDETGALATAFNNMAENIQNMTENVQRRAAELAVVAEVSTAASTILEVDRLLQEVVNLSKERFNLYHAHIYLLDEAGMNLVLASGAGEAGRQMATEAASIPLDREQSVVARAARERKGVTVNDVTQSPDFLPNPLLPDTRSELAVPMIVGGKVIGVFDVQSDGVGRFTDSDISIQTTLAAQVATSIQNVRSFEQSKIQADFESLVNTIGQKIQRSTTVEDTLQVAIREIGTALGASRVSANVQASRQADGQEAYRNSSNLRAFGGGLRE